MDEEAMAACVAGELKRAGKRLGVPMPAEISDHLTGLEFGLTRLAADPEYLPWSARAIILSAENKIVGYVRFHSRPDSEELRQYARGAVELGYLVFAADRGRGYAGEAAAAVMAWAGATFGVSHFVASIAPGNLASLRLAARLGFVEVGEQIDEIDGLEHVYLRVAT
jgi:[ribosomal protein S5]-alanine N-acetyltransferase